jgi:hypothetical protein
MRRSNLPAYTEIAYPAGMLRDRPYGARTCTCGTGAGNDMNVTTSGRFVSPVTR